ncbi:phage tail protein [Cupriavidus sp. BIC8F]|uniref:phage tail protein n=1 Tax=Cupriavidus sp. BIC8F TaxID=3079014 RepID=UPI002916F152|nr:phage tail protein [Cupriavidus sp. BIC8F]
MGQVGQLALGIVGAVVGFYASGGNPMGAQVGFLVGAGVGGLVFHENQKGPNPADLRIQSSTYGNAIPIVYGMYRLAGNVLWMSQPTKVGHNQGGKGGPSSTTYSYSVSVAVGLCEGPIQGVRRIWANNTLIYDVSTASGFGQNIASGVAALSLRIYLGDETQQPDAAIQADKGAANTPAFRGLAYVVIDNFDLSNYGNYLPSFSFEVMNGATGVYTTVTASAAQGLGPGYGGGFNYLSGTSGIGYTTQSGYLAGTTRQTFWRLDPYGATVYDAVSYTPGDANTNGPYYGLADVPGFVSRYNPGTGIIAGWFDAQLGTGFQQIYNFPAFNNFTQTPYWLKSGGDFYVTDTEDYDYPTAIYKGSLTNPSITTRSTVNGTWKLLGVTASYLYAMDGGNKTGTPAICRFDRNTLALVATLGTMPGVAVDYGCVGCVQDDSTIFYICGGVLYKLDTASGVSTLITSSVPSPIYTHSMRVVSPGVFMFGTMNNSQSSPTLVFVYQSFSDAQVKVSDILADVCTRAGLSSSQFDVSAVTQKTYGYGITNHSDARNNIAGLLAAYFIDVSDTGGKLKFVPRGAAPAVTIPYADLGVSQSMTNEEAQNPIKEVIAQDLDLSAQLTLSFIEWDSDYQTNTQTAMRLGTHARKFSANDFPLVLTANEAAGIVQSQLLAEWLGRQTFEFSTSLEYIAYEPSDVVYLTRDDGSTYLVRLVSCEYDGQAAMKWSAIAEEPTIYPNPATYTPIGGAPAGFVPQVIGYYGQTALAVLDVPPLRDTDTTPGVYLAMCGLASNWGGANVLLSRDGNSYAQAEAWFKGATMGATTSALANWTGGNIPDEGSTLIVKLYNGSLSSVSYSDFLNQVNACVVGSEVIFFRNATLTGTNTYTLSGLLRGRVGTEWAMSSHSTGEAFVLLDPSTLFRETVNVTDVGTTLYHEAQTIAPIKLVPGTPVSEFVSEACIRPLSPVCFSAFSGSAASVSDISLSWVRRARVNAAWLNGANVPLDQATESYRLTISTATGTQIRVVTVTAATSYTYTAASIAADGFVAGNTINFSVAQNSDQGVLGHAVTTSIVR